jgi:hypothetical protein
MTASRKHEEACIDFAGKNSGATRDAYREYEKSRGKQAYTQREADSPVTKQN